jgi:hypothetical protein
MNLLQAIRYPFGDRAWPRKLGLVAIVSPVPVFGQLFALGYAVKTLRRLQTPEHDGSLPEARLGWDLCWLGMQAMVLTLLCGLIVGFLGAPLYIGQDPKLDPLLPAMVQALQGPSMLLITIVSTVLSAAVLARFARIGTFSSALDPIELWKMLRAEPAIWVTAAIIGYIVTEGPYALAWVLPLNGGWDTAATVLACTVFWTYGQMINAHLIAEAAAWSTYSAAARAAEVRYRW